MQKTAYELRVSDWSSDVCSSYLLLHKLVVIVGELLKHREPRLLLAVGERIGNGDHFARRMLAIDIGALEREIDEAGDDIVLPDRHLAQHQRQIGSASCRDRG